jgi:hypothetical protein
MAGGGVGEAMLISALTGAGTSAVMGGDPLKGALLGAVTGGMGSAAGGALGGQAATVGTQAAAQTGAQVAGQTAASAVPGAAASEAARAAIVPELGAQGLQIPGSMAGTGSTFGGNLGASMNPYGLTGTGVPEAAVTAPTTVPTPSTPAVPQTNLTDVFKGQPGGPDFGQRLGNYIVQNPRQAAMITGGMGAMLNPPEMPKRKRYSGPLSRFNFDPDRYRPAFAEGGIMDLPATRRLMGGGQLGSYSDGGRLLKGPGDGMSDDIPAKIGKRQPARLADGEFVVPADVVSGIGNGSTDAGAKRLYAMMDKVRQARTGNKKQGREINPEKYMPA